MIKRLNLGKIVALLLLPIFIYAAEVSAFVDKKNVAKGSSVTLTIKAVGSDIEFPNINKIGNSPIKGVSNATNIAIINGTYSKTLTKKYRFIADKNLTIPSYSIKIEGKEYKTEPIEIKVTKQHRSYGSNSSYGAKVELIASKTDAYVGESLELNIKLTLPKNIVKYQIQRPNIKDFWIKELGRPQKRVFANRAEVSYKFLITPQKSGKLELGPVVIDIAKAVRTNNNPFGDDEFFSMFTQTLNWEKVQSNKLTFNIAPLPQNLEVAGAFDFKVVADKTEVKSGKPVNLTIKIKGKGNLEDIKKFNLDIPNAVVYSDEPKVKTYIQNGAEVGEFIQKIAVVAENNITIPSIEFKYFDLNKKEVVTKNSRPIDIKVIGAKKVATQTAPKIESATPVKLKTKEVVKTVYKEQNSWLKYLFLLVGFIAGVVFVYIFNRVKSKDKQKVQKPIVKQIKKAKSDKELFKILLPFAKEAKIIEDSLQKLEQNIYKGAKNEIEKSKIIEYFEDKQES